MALMFQRSYETNKLIEVLSAMKQGEMLTYAQLSEIAGAAICGANPSFASARRHVQANSPAVFGIMLKVGVKRLTDEEIVKNGPKNLSHVVRTVKKGARQLSGVIDYAGLSDEMKRSHQAHAVIYAKISDEASTKSINAKTKIAAIDGVTNIINIMDATKAAG